MKTFKTLLFAVWAGAAAVASAAAAPEDFDIPYTRFVLDNGLTLLVHEDHKAPIVAVNVWYHVGSKNEKPGKTGFAHLFEHLMFNGSEHHNDDYFKATEKVGATDLNGTTSEDRTNYFQNAPKDALDYLLWLESDRMGHLLGAVTQARLDEQRGVVQNEKRQSENQPYSVAYRLITKAVWPAGHPYSWTVIGEMEDLNAASLEDVREWFTSYYGAANATLVVAGDVDPQEVHEKVKRAFGSVPPGPPVARHTAWIAKRAGTQRQRVQDRVPLARLYMVWNIPNYGSTDGNLLDLVSDVLADGKTSRLYKRLVYDERIATDVSAYADLSEIAGTFNITVTAAEGASLARIEQAVNEELSRFLRRGPTARELQRVKTQVEARFVRGVERIGGFGGKSDQLAMNSVFLGDPAYHKTFLREVREATGRQLRDAARAWLSDGVYVLELTPFPKLAARADDVDRSSPPVPELRPEARFPEVRRATLSNGLNVVLAERPSVPVVLFTLMVDAGYATDAAAVPGTARLAADMLLQGTRRRTALEISEEAQLLGAYLDAGCSLDACQVSLNALKVNLEPSLALFADVALNPAFPAEDFKRRQELLIAGIRQEKANPMSVAMRVMPRLFYGGGHPYGRVFGGGSGTEEGVAGLTAADMARFHAAWFRPNNATLVVAGDITADELLPRLERVFGGWRKADTPQLDVAAAAQGNAGPTVTLIDRPGSIQSVVLAGDVMKPRAGDDALELGLFNRVVGGDFTSRINMNLREDKHWTYGARSAVTQARGPRLFMAWAPVQADQTAATMREIDRELRGVAGAAPVTQDEFERVVKSQLLRLPGSWETMASVAGALTEIVSLELSDDYFQRLPERVRSLTREELAAAAQKAFRPDRLTWVVVGDRKKIEPEVRALGFGALRVVDADGNPVAE